MKEAIPYEEFKQNPFAVLCTTTRGGHLSWFETGGGRWFTKPVSNFCFSSVKSCTEMKMQATGFLSMMAEHFTQGQSATDDGSSLTVDANPDAEGPHFDPMRRKLQIHVER